MRILIANDDGVGAAQLPNLIRWCQQHGEVTTVVPKVEQSGKSHGIELHRDLEAKEVELEPGIKVWTVDSTPADCVRFAVIGLGQTFDLVISGVNRGLNVGVDLIYSGTVGAASEAVNLGMKAVALSTTPGNYENATKHLGEVMEFFKAHDLLSIHNLYNVNIPADPKGIRITRMGGPYFSDDFVPVGNDLYRPTGKVLWKDSGDDTLDTDAVLRGKYISITPLIVDRTDHNLFGNLSKLNP